MNGIRDVSDRGGIERRGGDGPESGFDALQYLGHLTDLVSGHRPRWIIEVDSPDCIENKHVLVRINVVDQLVIKTTPWQ